MADRDGWQDSRSVDRASRGCVALRRHHLHGLVRASTNCYLVDRRQ